MLNKITKLFSVGQWRLPLLSLLLTLGVVGEQTTPVLSNQIQRTSTAIPLDAHVGSSNQTPVLSRLRQVREHRNLIRKLAIERENRKNLSQSQLQTTNPVKGELQQRSRLIFSTQLLRNINTPALNTGLFSRTPVRTRGNFPTEDGTYLYGQSPISDQVGQGYILFEKRQGRITGALYMPQSEFSCFQGAIEQSGELAMTVTTSPGEIGVNPVATGNQFQIPSYNDDQTRSYPYSVTLEDYHRIDLISANDEGILENCKQFYSSVN
ncbi:hypothetical protein [Nodularia chucula]|uniref:hypothetical protein n=1 Tax=Nodularia chucula TaxID=3093667 RepID=UPI0039C6A730